MVENLLVRLARWLLAVAALCAAAIGAFAETAPPSRLTIVVGGPQGGLSETAARLLAPRLAGEGYGVTVEVVSGDAGRHAARLMVQSLGRTDILLVAENLNLAMIDGGSGPVLPGLQAVAKLTDGIAVGLVASANAPFADWRGLVDAARRGRLRLATLGRGETAVALAMLQKRWRVRFQDVSVATTADMFAALASGAADVAIAPIAQAVAFDARALASFSASASALDAVVAQRDPAGPDAVRPPADAVAPLRMLASFAAERSPLAPDAPTLVEIARDRRLAFTLSVGVFAPLGVPAPVLDGLRTSVRNAAAAQAVSRKAAEYGLAWSVNGPDVLRETLARDARIAADVAAIR